MVSRLFSSIGKRARKLVGAPAKSPEVSSEALQRGLFRFGFFCHAAADTPKGNDLWVFLRKTWQRESIGDLVIWRHPETSFGTRRENGRDTILIGEAFLCPPDSGVEPLAALSAAGSDDEFLSALDRLSGRFVALRVHGTSARAYQDAFGAYTVFYRSEGAFAIGSHAELLAAAFGNDRNPEMIEFLGSRCFKEMPMKYLPGDATLYRGIRQLTPNQCYDVDERRTKRFWPRRPRGKADFDRFFDGFDAYFRGMAAYLKTRQPILNITGGVDSRTLIAANKHYAVAFNTVTWSAFNFKPWEKAPVEEIVRHLAGSHSWIDETNQHFNNAAMIGARNSGNYRKPSPAVAGTAHLFGDLPRAVTVNGHGAGVIRGAYNVRREPMRDFSTAEMIRIFQTYFRGVPPGVHEPVIRREFEAFHERTGYEGIAQFGFDPNDVFYWEHQCATWSAASLNAMHPAMESFFGFNSRQVAETAYGLPDEQRLTKKLFIEVIRRYDSKLADIHYQ